MFTIIFWTLIFLIFYTYLGYPLILWVLTILFSKPVKKENIIPSVSLIISAYNEEKVIERKIRNCLELGYPKDKLEIIIASDCSSDKTDQIVISYKDKGIELIRLDSREGKTAVQNKASQEASGEILVFSDADSMYQKDAIINIVKGFADPSVGCVGGRFVYLKPKGSTFGEEKGLLGKFEQSVREKESNLITQIVVSGGFYALRKSLYSALEPDLVSDFGLPLKVIKKGFRVIYEPNAIAYEETVPSMADEFKRKVRTISQGWSALFNKKFKLGSLLNPFKYGFISFQLFSHKILRWIAPVFLISLLIINAYTFNLDYFYKICMGIQIVFYILAITGLLLKNAGRKFKMFYLPFYFCAMNIAAVAGFWQFSLGKTKVKWNPRH